MIICFADIYSLFRIYNADVVFICTFRSSRKYSDFKLNNSRYEIFAFFFVFFFFCQNSNIFYTRSRAKLKLAICLR